MAVWNGAESPERMRSSKGRVMFLTTATHFSQCGDQKLWKNFLAAFETLTCGPMRVSIPIIRPFHVQEAQPLNLPRSLLMKR